MNLNSLLAVHFQSGMPSDKIGRRQFNSRVVLSQVKQFLNCVETAFFRNVTIIPTNHLDCSRDMLWHNSWNLIDAQSPQSSNEISIYLVKLVFPPFAHPISTIPAFVISEPIFVDSNELFSLSLNRKIPLRYEFELKCNGFLYIRILKPN